MIVGGGGHGLGAAYYLAKEHGMTNIAVLEKGWIGGGNTGRNTTIIRSNYLFNESAALYDHSVKLWESLSQALNYNVMFSPRGVMMLAHTVHDIQVFKRHVHANRCNGVDNEWLEPEQAKEFCPPLNIEGQHPLSRTGRRAAAARRAPPATMRSPGAMRARQMRSASTSSRTAKSRASAALPNGGGVEALETTRGTIRARKVGVSAAGSYAASSWRWPACSCPSRAIRCRLWSPSPSSRYFPAW